MRRKVEQEGYLQSVIKSESASSAELQPQPCLTMEHLHTQNQFYVPVQTHVSSKFRIISISQFQIIDLIWNKNQIWKIEDLLSIFVILWQLGFWKA